MNSIIRGWYHIFMCGSQKRKSSKGEDLYLKHHAEIMADRKKMAMIQAEIDKMDELDEIDKMDELDEMNEYMKLEEMAKECEKNEEELKNNRDIESLANDLNKLDKAIMSSHYKHIFFNIVDVSNMAGVILYDDEHSIGLERTEKSVVKLEKMGLIEAPRYKSVLGRVRDRWEIFRLRPTDLGEEVNNFIESQKNE